jgi:hypothetical protein
VRAIDPMTGARKWEFKMNDVTDAGIMTTGSDFLFSGGPRGLFLCTRCARWQAVVENQRRRHRRLRPNELYGGRKAIYSDFREELLVRFWSPGVGFRVRPPMTLPLSITGMAWHK